MAGKFNIEETCIEYVAVLCQSKLFDCTGMVDYCNNNIQHNELGSLMSEYRDSIIYKLMFSESEFALFFIFESDLECVDSCGDVISIGMYIESSSSDKGCGYTQDEYHSNYVVPALESFLLYLHEYNVEIVSICANDTYCFEYDEDSGEVIEVY